MTVVTEPERCNCDASCGENRYHDRGSPGCMYRRSGSSEPEMQSLPVDATDRRLRHSIATHRAEIITDYGELEKIILASLAAKSETSELPVEPGFYYARMINGGQRVEPVKVIMGIGDLVVHGAAREFPLRYFEWFGSVPEYRVPVESIEDRLERLLQAQMAHVVRLRHNHAEGHAVIGDGVTFYDTMRDEDGRSIDELINQLTLDGERVRDPRWDITFSVYAIAPAVIERCNFVPE